MVTLRNSRGGLRLAGRLVPQVDDTVTIPDLRVMMSSGRAVMRVDGAIKGSASAVSGKYVAPTGLTSDPANATNIRGVAGEGVAGNNGWSAILAGEADATRTLLKVVDWAGGSGTKPAVGMYIGTAGYVTAKADAFNFNAIKRVVPLSAQTNAQGIATFNFTSFGFATAPSVVTLPATTTLLSGPTRSMVSAVTKTGATVTVQQQAVLTGVVSLLAGATANILVIEQ